MSHPSSPITTTTLTQSTTLRAELKAWETTFAASHSGRKPTRTDIKAHPEIAQKYKLYTSLRAPLSPPASSPAPKRRHSSSDPTAKEESHQTPQKRHKHAQPGKAPHPAHIDPYDAPRSAKRTPVAQRTCIGPTPQKDGIVIGLFDLLSPESSKTQNPPTKQNAAAQATPSKQRLGVNGTPGRKTSTPRSQKASFLVTPSARRVRDQCTPRSRHSVSKLRFCDETPEFLRRDSQRDFSKGVDEAWSPMKARLPPKFAGRSLSALVKGLRDMEDEKLDEEMDLLREMETGENMSERGGKKKDNGTMVVKDSQIEMPLGADGEGAGSEAEGGKAAKIWKKKGQKRTTRKSNMRPSNVKWKPEAAWLGGEDDPAVEETHLVERLDGGDGKEPGDNSTVTGDGFGPEAGKDDEGKVKRAVKKIKATAHANFRALKIRNKNSKGKGGGRFGKRR